MNICNNQSAQSNFCGKGQEPSPRVEHTKGALLWYSPALSANTRLGWKGLPGTNTVAFHEHL